LVDFGTAHIAGYSYDGKVAGMIMIYDAFCKFFDIEPKFRIEDFLPAPQIERIIIGKDEKNPLLSAVNMLYDIKKDDQTLRQIIKEPAEKRGAYFDTLRRNYHTRREFQNTVVSVKGKKLQMVFKELGFKTE
jgi:erythronate-4-phosphate dehydrogenase